MPARHTAPTSSAVDAYLANAKQWPAECARLRAIMLDCGLSEALKWGKPCYGYEERNVAIIQPFKSFVALMFFSGALLRDTHGLLEKQGANTQSALRACFASVAQIVAREEALRDYVRQAIEVSLSGLTVPKATLVLVDELQSRLNESPALAAAFFALTPGRQRAHNLYVAGAKQSETRQRRVASCVPQILAGRGIRD